MQIVYERNLRPPEKQHEPWLARVQGQLLAACAALEDELERRPLAAGVATIDQAGITGAVVWHFLQMMVPDLVDASRHPALQAFSAGAERLSAFEAAPHGATTMAAASAAPGPAPRQGASTGA